MIAFNYAERFSELSELPQLKRLEILDQADRLVSRSWRRNTLRFAFCLAIGFLVGLAPRMLFQMPGVAEGLLLGLGTLTAVGFNQRLYGQLLHEKVREILSGKCS